MGPRAQDEGGSGVSWPAASVAGRAGDWGLSGTGEDGAVTKPSSDAGPADGLAGDEGPCAAGGLPDTGDDGAEVEPLSPEVGLAGGLGAGFCAGEADGVCVVGELGAVFASGEAEVAGELGAVGVVGDGGSGTS